MNSKKDLEIHLRSLRKELSHNEKRLQVLLEKDTPQESSGGVKRTRSEDHASTPNKRLKSTVSVVPNEAGSSEKLPPVETAGESKPEDDKRAARVQKQENSEDKKRNRRLFGSLVLGTLNSFKKQSETETQSLQKRKEVEKQTEEKVFAEHQKFVEEREKKRQEDISLFQIKIQQVMQQIKGTEDQLVGFKASAHAQRLSQFLVTKNCNPPIYYFPAKRDQFTEQVLGTKPVPVPPPPPAPASSETPATDPERTTAQQTQPPSDAPSGTENGGEGEITTLSITMETIDTTEVALKSDNSGQTQDKEDPELVVEEIGKVEDEDRSHGVVPTRSLEHEGKSSHNEELAEGVVPSENNE